MDVLVQKLLMNLLILVYKLLNDVFQIFRILTGLEKIEDRNGDSVDLINAFIDNQFVTKIFFGILIVAVVICGICIITATVKAVANLSRGERKSISKITGQGISMVFITLFMAVIMISGITVANSLLRDINSAFKQGVNEENICNELFDIAVDDKAKEWEPEYKPEYVRDPVTNEIITDLNGDPIKKTDANGNIVYEKVVDSSGNPVVDSNGNYTYVVDHYTLKEVEGSSSGWRNEEGKMPDEFNILNEDADSILGKYPKNFLGFEQPDQTPTLPGQIYFGSFNFLTGYFSAVIVLVAVCSACLGLVKRLYDLVTLFLALPIIISTIPLDDGARFKAWRETVVSKVILAYGAVFAVNVFIVMVPIINSLQIHKILKMFLVVGGGLSISGGMLLFARLFGTDASESRDMAQSARTLLAGGMAGMHGIKFVAQKAGRIANNTVGAKGLGGDLVNSIFGKNPGLVGTTGISASASNVGSTAVSPMATNLDNALKNAGIKTGTWYKGANGRFMSGSKVQELLNANKSKE